MVTSFIILSVIISNHLAHRAMEDVRAMKKVFLLQLSVASCFVQPEYSKSDIVGHWQTLHHERAISQQFTIHLGSSCTKTMAKRLNEHNITIEMLKSVFEPEL